MNRQHRLAAVLLAAGCAATAYAATWSSAAQYGACTIGAYGFDNDVWGAAPAHRRSG